MTALGEKWPWGGGRTSLFTKLFVYSVSPLSLGTDVNK